jgi:CRISPR-associated protein Csm1
MKIAHIFNEVDTNKNKFYISGCFDIDYIDCVIDAFKSKKSECEVGCGDLDNEEYKKSLKPISESKIIDEYDNERVNRAVEGLGDEVLLLSGDFFGIQDFIFNGLETKKAAKIIRARSAMVQLITKAIANELKERLDAREVLFGAGKFLMVCDLAKKDEIKKIQEILNEYFFKNYFGLSGVVLSFEKAKKDDVIRIEENEEIKKVLSKLALNNEKAKLNKFDLTNRESFVIDIFENAKTEDEVCEYCKKRLKETQEACLICENEINLGTLLTKFNSVSIKLEDNKKDFEKDEVFILKINQKVYYAKFGDDEEFDISNDKMTKKPKWPLKAYVPTKDNKIKTFEEIEEGFSGLMMLKADIDRLGNTFKKFYYDSFKKFNRLSREINFFFANYVPYVIKQNYPNIYVVFAGGDDLFLIGPYLEVVDFAKDIRERFYNFTLQKATLSMGLVMFKHSTPVLYVNEEAEKAEKRAKSVKKDNKDRNGIDLFGIGMKFEEFKDIEEKWQKIYKKDEMPMSFLYRLIEIINMASEMDNNPKNAIWRSKLSYIVNRNFKKIEFLKELVDLIEEYREKVLPSIYLTIYKRRDDG